MYNTHLFYATRYKLFTGVYTVKGRRRRRNTGLIPIYEHSTRRGGKWE